MKLPGPVAVIDGRIFPLASWEVETVRDTAKLNGPTTLTQGGTYVRAEHFEGTMEILVGSIPASITSRPMHEVFLFPKSGTGDRVKMSSAIFSSVFFGEVGQTTEIEFVAEQLAR